MKRRILPAIVLVSLVAVGSIAYVFNRARPTADVIATCDLATRPTRTDYETMSAPPLAMDKYIVSIGDRITISTNLPADINSYTLGTDDFRSIDNDINYQGRTTDSQATLAATITDGSPNQSRFTNTDNHVWPNIWEAEPNQQLTPGQYSMTFTITGGTIGWRNFETLGSTVSGKSFDSSDYFCIQPPITATAETPPVSKTITPTPIITPVTSNPTIETPIATAPTSSDSSPANTTGTTTGVATPIAPEPTPTDTVTNTPSATQDSTSPATSTTTASTQEVVIVAAITIPSTTITTSTEAKVPAPIQSTLQVAKSSLASNNTAPTVQTSNNASTSTTSTATTATTEPTVKAGAPVVVKLKDTTPKKPVTISVNGKTVATVTPSKANVDVPVTIPVSTPDGKASVTAHSDNWNSDLNFPVKVASAKAGMSTEKRNSLIAIIIFIALLSIKVLYVVFGGHKKTEDPQLPVDPQIPPTKSSVPPTSTSPTPPAQYQKD